MDNLVYVFLQQRSDPMDDWQSNQIACDTVFTPDPVSKCLPGILNWPYRDGEAQQILYMWAGVSIMSSIRNCVPGTLYSAHWTLPVVRYLTILHVT